MAKKPMSYYDTAQSWKKIAKKVKIVLDPKYVREFRSLAKLFNKVKFQDMDEVEDEKVLVKITKKFNDLAAYKTPYFGKAKVAHANSMISSVKFHVKEALDWEDPEMASMYFDDAADHLQIGLYLKNMKYKKAQDLANDLDTASRDEIPDSVWRYLTGSQY